MATASIGRGSLSLELDCPHHKGRRSPPGPLQGESPQARLLAGAQTYLVGGRGQHWVPGEVSGVD